MKEAVCSGRGQRTFSTLKSPLFTPALPLISGAWAEILPCRSSGRARLKVNPSNRWGNDTGLTRWCQVTETFSSSSNSEGMFSINSFHDLVIPIPLNLKDQRRCPVLPSPPPPPSLTFLFSISAAIIFLTLRDVSLLQCHHVKAFFSLSLSLWHFQTHNSGHLWFSAPSVWQSYHPDHLPLHRPLHSLLMFV